MIKLIKRNYLVLCGWFVALTLALACGASAPDLSKQVKHAAQDFARACPQALETPQCVYAASRIARAVEALDEARKAPSFETENAAGVAVYEAVKAVEALNIGAVPGRDAG